MPSRTAKAVTFGDVTITEYPIILGDHPSCTGCPITIGWKPMGRRTLGLDEHEVERDRQQQHDDDDDENRSSLRRGPGNSSSYSCRAPVIPVRERSRILLEAGYTPQQIVERALEVFEVKDLREETLRRSQHKHHSYDETIEKLSKNVKATLVKLAHTLAPRPRVSSKRSVNARMA